MSKHFLYTYVAAPAKPRLQPRSWRPEHINNVLDPAGCLLGEDNTVVGFRLPEA